MCDVIIYDCCVVTALNLQLLNQCSNLAESWIIKEECRCLVWLKASAVRLIFYNSQEFPLLEKTAHDSHLMAQGRICCFMGFFSMTRKLWRSFSFSRIQQLRRRMSWMKEYCFPSYFILFFISNNDNRRNSTCRILNC